MNSTGFIMMLDVSGSMCYDIDLLKIYAKAFVRYALPRDQFGVNSFNDTAAWIYPTGTNPDIVTVSPFKAETGEAANQIELIKSGGTTNIGAAIALGENMIQKSDAGLKAFVLFSDGEHNTGPKPDTVLKNEPPLYVAALGYWMKESYFAKMLAKNPKSKLYQELNAVKVMEIFNDIRSDSSQTMLTANDFDLYQKGSDYIIRDFTVPPDSRNMQLSVVWSNNKYQYTGGNPTDNMINVILVDPNNKTTGLKPDITEKGFCIFNMDQMYAGNWKCLIQYVRLNDDLASTFGALSLDTSIKVNIEAPMILKAGNSAALNLWGENKGAGISHMTVGARLSKPFISLEKALKKYAGEIEGIDLGAEDGDYADAKVAKLMKYRKANLDKHDILGNAHSHSYLPMTKDGSFVYNLSDTQDPGIYALNLDIEGIDPASGQKFKCRKTHSFIVE
jgi:hypothetical protein